MDNLISRQEAIDVVKRLMGDFELSRTVQTGLHILPSAQPWIPIKWHDCTDEDREKYGFSDDIVAVFDNVMPDDNQEILITTSYGSVEKDVCYIDEGFSLDSGWNWIDDVKAWMPLPEPYKEVNRNG